MLYLCVCQESEESGRMSASRGFDVDYGRFYNTSYLKTSPASSSSSHTGTGSRAEYRRSSPSISSTQSPSHAGVRHYHRPPQQNFSYSRRPLRTGNKGVHLMATSTHHAFTHIAVVVVVVRFFNQDCGRLIVDNINTQYGQQFQQHE